MKIRFPRPLILVLVALASLFGSCSDAAAQPSKVFAPRKPTPPVVKESLNPHSPATQRTAVGGLWMTSPTLKSSIYIRNVVETDPITVTPILYLSNGEKYRLTDVTVEPAGIAIIGINEQLQGKGISSWATLSGYVELDYVWYWDPFCATVRNVDTAHSLIFTFALRPSLPLIQAHNSKPIIPAATHTMEGMWWKQESNVTGFVTLANLSSEPTEASVHVTDSEAKSIDVHRVTISPHGMKTVKLPELQSVGSNQGGVRIVSSRTTDTLVVNGVLEDPAVGYSATMPFALAPADLSEPLRPASVAELGLMTGAADPMMLFPAGTTFTPYSILRNVTDVAISLTPTLWWMEAGAPRSVQLSKIVLLPYQTQNLDMKAVLLAFGGKAFNGDFNLIFEGDTRRFGLLLASGSVDQTDNYVFEVLPKGVGESTSKSLQYWSTGNGDDTMVTVWNPADEAQDFIFRLFFSGGHYSLPLRLGARVSRTFNVSEIVRTQVPDPDGNIIPASSHEGGAQILGSHAENESIIVAVEAGVYNVRKATCAVICMECDGLTTVFMNPSTFTVASGSTQQLHFFANYNTGGYEDMTSYSTWTSNSPSVAGVIDGDVAGVSPGSTSVMADTTYEWGIGAGYICVEEGIGCPTSYLVGSASGTVVDTTPTLTGIYPSDWNAGSTQSVTFTGQNFGTNVPTLNFSPGAGISYTVSSDNDTQIVANVKVASGTPNESVTVTVTSNGYGGSGFNGGGSGQSPTSSPVQANIHAPMNSPEVTVIAWVNGNAPDLKTLPTGANSQLITQLNSSPGSCAALVSVWALLGTQTDLQTSQDTAYANAWLVANSANTAPPATITPSAQFGGGNYRLFNDYGNGKGGYNVGITPDPCKTGVIPGWVEAGQPSQYMGASGTSPTGKVYQLAEGRIGRVGQAGSQTINNGRTVPWIWSVIEFDSSGNPTYSDVGMFPTYSVYSNGSLVKTYTQSAVADFVAKDQTYQRTPSQVQ